MDQPQEVSMEKIELGEPTQQDFLLIDGQFTADQAQEVLMHMISGKLSFHSILNLRSLEHQGQADPVSEKRIEELKKTRLELLKVIQQAEERGVELNIFSEITVSFKKSDEESD